MADLADYRKEIDELDAQLIPLFERRLRVVRKVAEYKKAHKAPVYQGGREQEVLQKAVDRLEDPAYAQETIRFMNSVMGISRAVQNREIAQTHPRQRRQEGRVGFYGPSGSFTEQAALRYFGEARERAPYAEFEDIFKALQNGEIVYGVLPIENSSTGAIAQVYDLLGSYGFYIVGEQRVRISQNLIGVPGASLKTIRTVYSHPQGIEQSSMFLRGHPEWELIPFHSTSESARMVARENNPALAAIAGVQAAKQYGLRVIAPDIQNNSGNTTRFIVIGRALEPENADKVSVMFSLDNESGALFRTLRYFADHRINLVKIESRPIPDTLWNYLFYLDFEGELESDEVQNALAGLTEDARHYKLLGAYRSAAGV